MRFHVLGLAHTQTTREFSVCAFTTKVRLLCKMLTERGHTVYHYGVEGSDPICTENVAVCPEQLWAEDHRTYDWRQGFKMDARMLSAVVFERNAIAEIGKRKQPGDFLLCPFGVAQQPIAEAHPDMIVVESGIGYGVTFAKYRVFETYSWAHSVYGRETERQQKKVRALCGVFEPPWTDAVIPQYLDLDDYPFQPAKAHPPYAIHLGRNVALKGLAVAAHACRMAGVPLYVAGQAHVESPDWTNLGVLSIEERARWVGGASCLIAPTLYNEPGGTVTLEAAAYGTPVVTTDWGSFTETVLHGETGWRCRTFAEFVWAVANANQINPARCREVAEERWSLEKVGAMYEHYFRSIAAQEAGGDAPVRDLDWLRRES